MKPAFVAFSGGDLVRECRRAELETNIEYGKAGGAGFCGSTRTCPMAPDLFPVVIAIHGGGWCTGDKSGKGDFAPVLKALTANHFTWFSIDYRLALTINGLTVSTMCRPPFAG